MIAILSPLSLRLRFVVAALVLVGFVVAAQAPAQEAPPTVSVSFGIDTTMTDVGNVVRLVRAYLAKPDSSARSRGLWSMVTDFDRRVGDLTLSAYQGFPATIVGVASDGKPWCSGVVLAWCGNSVANRWTNLTAAPQDSGSLVAVQNGLRSMPGQSLRPVS